MFDKIFNAFQNVEDKRVVGRTKYSLAQILTIFFIGNLLGFNQWKKIYIFAQVNAKWFFGKLPGLKQIPGVDTIARTLSKKIDPEQLTSTVSKLIFTLMKRNKKNRKPGRPRKNSDPDIVSIDGKTLKGAAIPGETKSRVHIINVVIDFVFYLQQKVADKTNEIPTVPIVIKALNKLRLIKGRLITLDAMGCQRDTVDLIHELKAFYLISLKGNQSGLLEEVMHIFTLGLDKYANEFSYRTHKSGYDKGHGRIDMREITVVYLKDKALEWLTKAKDWSGLETVVKVTRTYDVLGKDGNWDRKTEDRYYICSQSYSPQKMLKYVLKHWEVETFHFYLDKAHKEDKCKVYSGNGPEIYSLIRKFALDFLLPLARKWAKTSVETIFELLQWDEEFRDSVLEKHPDDVISPLAKKVIE